ncbi:MAG: hypothetical protein HY559_03515 [Gammaproteobacteria bacterium]|nr:hypothetical protein [Gammaproteobacteria bacterium]
MNHDPEKCDAPQDKKSEASDEVLKKVDKILPGIGSLFKKAEKSKVFGRGIQEIRKEMERRFGKGKK